VQDLVQLSFSPPQAKHICDPNGGWYQPFMLGATTGGLVDETWTYASSTTVTVTTDATTRYQKGQKVRFKQGGSYKYFYIVAVAATTLTLAAGSDYSVANAAITDVNISNAEVAFGFPATFTYTPTYTGSGTLAFGTVAAVPRFFIVNGNCILNIYPLGTVSGTGVEIRFSLPVTSHNNDPGGGAWIEDTIGPGGSWYMLDTNTIAVRSYNAANWNTGASKGFRLTAIYKI